MRIIVHWQSVVACTVLGAGLIGFLARPASAGRPYNLRSFSGTYKGSAVEIRQDPGSPVEYCDIEGSFTPDGRGNGELDLTRQCSITGMFHHVLTFVYTVSPEGQMIFIDSLGDGGRAQLVDDGNSAITSTARDVPRDPVVFVRHGVFTRPRDPR
jgi:hypothetical protein